MGFPGWPPGPVPAVDPGEDRMRPFDRHFPEGAIGAAMYFLDELYAQGSDRKIGVERLCVFHIEISHGFL